MTGKKPEERTPSVDAFRERAEKMIRASRADVSQMSREDVQSLVYELQVHQAELEIQNEELRTAQVALAESRDRYSDLYEFSPVGYLTVDSEGTVREANLTAAAMLRLERGQLVGNRMTSFISGESQDDWYLHVRAAFESDGKQICELSMRAADDTSFWARCESVVRRTDGEDPECRVAIIDVTSKKEAEDLLRHLNAELQQTVGHTSEELRERVHELALLAKAIANLFEGVMITSDELDWPGPKIVFVNQAMCRITGYTADELIGRTPRILQGDGTDREVMAELKRTLGENQSYCCEVVSYRKDGTPYDAELYVTALYDAEGNRTNFVSIHRDVTERKRNRQALRDREQRLSAILNTAIDAVITIDRQGIINGVNPAAERMFGYRQDEFLGQNIKMLMPPPYRDEHDGYIARYLETGEAKIIGAGRELEGMRRDGTVFPIELSVSEVDHLGLFTGIIRDLTERNAARDRLIQSERLVALGEAMTGLTHESRNALARSEANLRRLARRMKDDEEVLQLIKGAQRANDDIQRQFEEVRQYAVPIQLRRESIDIAATVQQVWDELAPVRKERRARLRAHHSNCNAICEADAYQLKNVFRNVLENSLAACVDPVEIEVNCEPALIGDQPALQISICDNGPGIAADVRPRAFEAFFTTKTRGTGLGLPIVKRAVEAHGGTVSLGSGNGGGAEIIITLPRLQE